MPEKTHWPFSGNVWARNGHDEERTPDIPADKARWVEARIRRERARHDRFIVGGRAHDRKSGLS